MAKNYTVAEIEELIRETSFDKKEKTHKKEDKVVEKTKKKAATTKHQKRLTLWRVVASILLLATLGLLAWSLFFRVAEPGWVQSWSDRGWSVRDEAKSSDFANANPVWDVAVEYGYVRPAGNGLTVADQSASAKYNLEVLGDDGKVLASVWCFNSEKYRFDDLGDQRVQVFYDPVSGHIIKATQHKDPLQDPVSKGNADTGGGRTTSGGDAPGSGNNGNGTISGGVH